MHCDIAAAPNWLRYAGRLTLGLLAGTAMTIALVLALAPLFFFWAVAFGPICALAIWLLCVTFRGIRMRRTGIDIGESWFLIGFGVIPVLYGTIMLIGMTLE
ncbi:hypothetical protein JK358_31270 [Nocardia sp. 2]|uniref:DUF4190 domain-containing protein n=1 Tax=Nocardia acididurans TaxID=2802282 RepID=A0ABS1MGU9_9NOCA|nr:hypothetical protein [Nocardia acididurans]MBL1078894.1 hypothetical protein [Nocardia acididurans]